MSDPSAWAYVVPLASAAISTAGALYVGWRNRRLTRQVAAFQTHMTDVIFQRNLCLTLGSRVLLLGRLAADSARILEGLVGASSAAQRSEAKRRADQIDRACEAFLETWAEMISWGVASGDVATAVDSVCDAIEAVRLHFILSSDDASLLDALLSVEASANSCSRVSRRLAKGHVALGA